MKLTKDTIKSMRTEINAALGGVANKFCVTLTAERATFDPREGTGTFKLEIVALGDDGTARDVDAEEFIRCAHMVGLEPDDLGKQVVIQRKRFTISGFNPKAHKNSIMLRSETGKEFVCAVDAVRRQLHPATV